MNKRQYEILDELLANPADAGTFYGYNLQQLVNSFPQSGILRALLAHAGTNDDVKHAAAYYNPPLLHKLINEGESLAPVQPAQIINLVNAKPFVNRSTVTAGENYFNSGTVAESPVTPVQAPVAEVDVADVPPPVSNFVAPDAPPPVPQATETQVDDLLPPPVPVAAETTPPAVSLVGVEPEKPDQQIDDDVYDEIVGIDNIEIPKLNVPEPAAVAASVENTDAEAKPAPKDETDKWIIGNIASTDYFMFDKSVADTRTEDQAAAPPPVEAEQESPAAQEAPPEVISKYNDEKMPYTFMWWLDKTRKEYASVYQPYSIESVIPAKNAPEPAVPPAPQTADALQHQYYENIFHAQSLEELEKTPQPDVPEVKSKEDIIIEKFIREEPQIRPPSANKIDNENKAKKSSEDRNELVSETLARIYTEQMLYHKAIATYKKLMLKFPDKSRYFASQIEQIEKKIN
ncbi:hypothetical protein [Mucilaginibacter celer]|uniref:hypothetical protein n=1 Tax=Mucilaginibacter celer TaxID=2305508 RepID=UPI0013CE7D35|nr:hypothetical protein [Mucilaginibacter celer]